MAALGRAPEYLRFHVEVRPAAADRPAVDSSGSFAAHRATPRGLTGPRLRRILGKALIAGFCPFGEPRCQQSNGRDRVSPADRCPQIRRCPYGVLYAAAESRRPPFATYVLPPCGDGRPGRIELTLLGPGWSFYRWLLSSLGRALEEGVGRRRVRWRIEEVLRVSASGRRQRLCGGDLGRLPAALLPDRLEGPAPVAFPGTGFPGTRVAVRLLSPTRLVRDGRLLRGGASVPFDVLVGRILDRWEGLFGDRASELFGFEERRELQSAAAAVPLLENRTRWVEVRDYSARQGSELRFGGKVGGLTYGDGAARFLPILRAGEIVHVGKNPTAGCGRIRVESNVR